MFLPEYLNGGAQAQDQPTAVPRDANALDKESKPESQKVSNSTGHEDQASKTEKGTGESEHRVKDVLSKATDDPAPATKQSKARVKEVWFAGSHSDMYVK
jgi:hypothetical protein